ncbi:hypothetical protein GGR56DRAFT_688801 [Xylariaceae sp. FL0804]|nr:hypothetical protein GGR56DRAFT_688801 [Xylariaceae sp. FL0804]
MPSSIMADDASPQNQPPPTGGACASSSTAIPAPVTPPRASRPATAAAAQQRIDDGQNSNGGAQATTTTTTSSPAAAQQQQATTPSSSATTKSTTLFISSSSPSGSPSGSPTAAGGPQPSSSSSSSDSPAADDEQQAAAAEQEEEHRRRDVEKTPRRRWTWFELRLAFSLICRGEHLAGFAGSGSRRRRADKRLPFPYPGVLSSNDNNNASSGGKNDNEKRDVSNGGSVSPPSKATNKAVEHFTYMMNEWLKYPTKDEITNAEGQALLAELATKRRGALRFLARQDGPARITRATARVFERALPFDGGVDEWVLEGRRERVMEERRRQRRIRREGIDVPGGGGSTSRIMTGLGVVERYVPAGRRASRLGRGGEGEGDRMMTRRDTVMMSDDGNTAGPGPARAEGGGGSGGDKGNNPQQQHNDANQDQQQQQQQPEPSEVQKIIDSVERLRPRKHDHIPRQPFVHPDERSSHHHRLLETTSPSSSTAAAAQQRTTPFGPHGQQHYYAPPPMSPALLQHQQQQQQKQQHGGWDLQLGRSIHPGGWSPSPSPAAAAAAHRRERPHLPRQHPYQRPHHQNHRDPVVDRLQYDDDSVRTARKEDDGITGFRSFSLSGEQQRRSAAPPDNTLPQQSHHDDDRWTPTSPRGD